jgi:arylsulfatase A-like enzyme
VQHFVRPFLHRLGHARIACSAGLALLLTGCAGEVPPLAPRSIILLDIDTLRADHLGCYGYGLPTSPNIDALAAESVRFEWAFSQAPYTAPSQGSLLTGLYPTAHGLVLPSDRLHEEVTTLAETLAAAGFATAGFVDGGHMAAEFGIGQGFQLYHNADRGGLAGMAPRVLDWLGEHADERFLLLVHTYDVHTPYDPPEPYRSQFLAGLDPPSPGFTASAKQLRDIRVSKYHGSEEVLPPNDVAYARALYDGGIRSADEWIGTYLTEIRRMGLDRDALIVLFSDHGEEFQEHGSVLHEKLYATVTRIPLLIRFPAGGRRGTVSTVVEGVDLMPTLLEAVGVEPPPGLHGESLLPLIRGERPSRPPLAFGESPFFGIERFVATDEYRLQYSRVHDRVELYSYRDDPHEQRDLAAERRAVVARMRPAIARWESFVAPTRRRTARGPLSDETRKQLEALGYL